MRSYEKTHSSFQKILQNLKKEFEKCDIFIHTWRKKEPETPTWHEGSPEENEIIKEEQIKNLYKPIKLLIEEQNIKDSNETLFGICHKGLRYASYSAHAANQLKKEYEKENNFKYDVVIKIRPDVEFFSNFIVEELGDNENIWTCQQFTKRSVTDVVVFSNSENMNKVCEYYNNFDFLMQNVAKIQNQLNGLNNESVFDYYLNNLSIPKKVSKFVMPRDWRLFRSWWPSGHKVGHRKWDPDLATIDIENNDKYKYFRR